MKTLTLISVMSIAAIVGFSPVTATSPRFYTDDPLLREPEPQDAGGAAPSYLDLMYELTYNLFAVPRHKPSGVRAHDTNTMIFADVSVTTAAPSAFVFRETTAFWIE